MVSPAWDVLPGEEYEVRHVTGSSNGALTGPIDSLPSSASAVLTMP